MREQFESFFTFSTMVLREFFDGRHYSSGLEKDLGKGLALNFPGHFIMAFTLDHGT